MQVEKLACDAVEVLATAVVDPASLARPAEVHDLVQRWFELHGQRPVFELFAADPANDARMRDLLQRAVERDGAFARDLAAAIDRTRPGAPPAERTGASLTVGNAHRGTFQVSGRDNNSKTSIEFGGGGAPLVVAIVVVAIALVVFALLR